MQFLVSSRRTRLLMDASGLAFAFGLILLEKAARYDFDAQIVGGKESDIPERLESLKFNLEKYMLPEMWAAHFRRLRKSDPELFAVLDV